MENRTCKTCFLGEAAKCPIMKVKHQHTECFAWVRDKADWEKRREAVRLYMARNSAVTADEKRNARKDEWE